MIARFRWAAGILCAAALVALWGMAVGAYFAVAALLRAMTA